MKTISRYIMTLALLITAATGAWAEETVETTLWEGTYTPDGVEINSTTVSEFKAGDVLRVYVTVPVSGANFKIVYKGASNDWTETAIPSAGSEYLWINDGETYKDITFTEADITALTGTGIYIYKGDYSTITKVTLITPASGPAVTINDAKTEASFKMPQYDATATYTIKRDISVDVTATMGDGTDGVRYRVKKAQQGEGYEPADLNMMEVLGLVVVNDGIEQKDLTLNQDYYCRIYKLDEQTQQPAGDGVEFADFDFAPGLYALKAFAKKGSNYAGETALSNTFQLFQGYEVTVGAGEYATFYKEENLYVEDTDAELYTISSVTESEAVLSDAITVAPANTPLLVYNKSEESKTFLLIPTTDDADEVTPATQFVGTLEATTIPASATGADNYALNGYAFVWVKTAIEVGANKCWLHIASQHAAARAMTRSIVGGNGTTGIDAIENVTIDNEGWYDMQGRKLQAKPNRGGIYIHNGKKVVIR